MDGGGEGDVSGGRGREKSERLHTRVQESTRNSICGIKGNKHLISNECLCNWKNKPDNILNINQGFIL